MPTQRIEAGGYRPDMEIVHSLYPVDTPDCHRYRLQFHLSRGGFEKDVTRVSDEHVCIAHNQETDDSRRERVDSQIAGEYHDETADYYGNRRECIADSVK